MVSDVVLGTILGAMIALVGTSIQSYVNWRQTRHKTDEANKRRRAEFYLEKKVDSLVEYHSNLTIFIEEIEVVKNRVESGNLTREEFDGEFTDLFNSYHNSMAQATAFLTEEQTETLGDTVVKFREGIAYIEEKLEGLDRDDDEEEEELYFFHDWDREDQLESFEKAKRVVEEEINDGISGLE